MRCGLWLVSDTPNQLAQAIRLLNAQDIPCAGCVDTPTPVIPDREAFLYRAGAWIFLGEAVPAGAVIRHLSGDALPGNVLRRYLEWQHNLLPYLSSVDAPQPDDGFFRLGESLLVCPLSDMGTVDVRLPAGHWTDILTGEVASGHFRRMRSPNAMPILAKEGAIIPTGDAACPTLHWYQAPEEAIGLMHAEPYHLIVHRNGAETCLR